MGKVRADVLVFEQGLADSRTRAQALILAGAVLDQDGHRIDKAGTLLSADTALRLQNDPLPYVSRGGLKLKAALDHFNISLKDKICLDVGASTGGFSDCALQAGARKIYALDVGVNQLAWSLRNDDRIEVFEKTNIRTCPGTLIENHCAFICIDVSFISLSLVLAPALRFAESEVEVVALIKPQFEAGKADVGKGGIVRDAGIRREVVSRIAEHFFAEGLGDLGCIASPILGAKGNKEFLIYGRRGQNIKLSQNHPLIGEFDDEFFI
tara:strand:+ start:978 stop:1778 length:801 start_codon:yes stop_codon:yes gene_type:complete